MSGLCLPIARDDAADARFVAWEACVDPCAGLDEAACAVDPRCVARYAESTCPPNADCALLAVYDGCVAQPRHDPCLGLDEQRCGATPGCGPAYGGPACDCAAGTDQGACSCPFAGCGSSTPPGATCRSDADCAAPARCTVSDGDCREAPCEPGKVCTTVCTGICVLPDDPPPLATCFGDEQCGAGQHCSTRDGACLPPPGCDGGEVCPAVCAGTCVSDDDPASCFAIVDESVCVARADCAPIYAGSGCSCDASGCGCERYDYVSCRPRVDVPPPGCEADVAGSWSTMDGAPGVVERHLALRPDGTFTVDDLVAPCPPEAVCVWSGIISNAGSWSPAPSAVRLSWKEPLATWPGSTFPAALKLDGCGPAARLVDPESGRAFARVGVVR